MRSLLFETGEGNRHRLHIPLLLSILVVSVLLRAGVALALGDTVVELPGTADQVTYHALAQRLMDGYGFTFGEPWWPTTGAGEPTAHWSFLYTFFLAGVYGLLGPHALAARLIQAVLVGALQPSLIYVLASRLFNRTAGLMAAAFTALYAYFVYYAGTLMTEPFYITAILGAFVAAVLLSHRARSGLEQVHDRRGMALLFLLAISISVAVLLRQLFMLIVPFLLAWIWWSVREASGKSSWRTLVLPLATLAASVLPFTVYNYLRFGEFVLLNTNAGFAFFWGNHPVYGTRFIPILSDYLSLIPRPLFVLNEAQMDKELLGLGLRFVLEDPVRYAMLSLSRIPVYFTFWPTSSSGLVSNLSRTLSFGLAWPFMLYGLLRSYLDTSKGLATWLRSPAALLVGFSLLYTLIHVLTWTLVRYRLPIDAVMLAFAAYGALDLLRRLVHPRDAGNTTGEQPLNTSMRTG